MSAASRERRDTARPSSSRADPLIRYRVAVLLALTALVAVLGWQARHFGIDASPDTLLTPDNEHYLATRLVNRRFGTDESLVIAYQPTGHALFSEATLQDLGALSRDITALPRVASVRSLHNVPIPTGDDAVDALQSVGDDTTPGGDQGPALADLADELRGHPIYERLLVDEQQTVTALQIRFAPDPELAAINDRILELEHRAQQDGPSAAQQRQLDELERRAEPIEERLAAQRAEEMQQISEIVDRYRDDANLYLGGIHALEQGLIRIIEHDVLVFGSAIGAAIAVMLVVLLRSVRWMLIPVTACAASVTSSIGLFVVLGIETTVISANFVSLQLILTLAIAMHLVVQYRQTAARQPDWSVEELIRSTMARKTKPCVYAGLTTSVGFASLLISGIQPVIAFGWMMIVAMMVSLLLTLIAFPALVAVLRPPGPRASGRLMSSVLERLAGLAVRHGRLVLAGSGLVLLWGLTGALRLELENSFLDYFDQSTALHEDLSFIDRHLGGTTPLDVVYTIPEVEREDDLVLTAEAVQGLQRIHQELESHQAVGKVLSITSFTGLARRLNEDRPLTETELTAAYRLIPDDVRNELIGGFFDADAQQARLSVQIQDTTPGLDRSALLRDIRTGLEDDLGIPSDRYQLTNLAVLFEDILARLFDTQITTIALVTAALGLAFWAAFGSISIAFAALLPNVLATTSVFGVMGWFGIELDVMTITIAAITIGIAVDDTIHYVHRYLDERHERSAADAVRTTHLTVGFAIVYTSMVITSGFGLLTLSDFVPSVLFGALTGVAMMVALAADLTLLPVLLARYRTPRARSDLPHSAVAEAGSG